MSSKAERIQAVRDTVTALLRSVDHPMTLHEIHTHAMFKPVAGSLMSLAQVMKGMVKSSLVVKTGRGSTKATFRLPVRREQKTLGGVITTDEVRVRLRRDGTLLSVSAGKGVPVTVELVD